MPPGTKNRSKTDPLTAWELAALNVLIALNPEKDLDVKASRENMLTLIKALDRGALDPVLKDPNFMEKTERLLLAMLRGERIEVGDPSTYEARKEIFAAAQVIYNQAVVRGFWHLHPEIKKALQGQG
jgi:hypothetical protein